ncbi:MAG: hypothetical protein IID41_16305, partial [Planctomycetes bacterium]|nr:hypothetical protein [Planctomycetota bacterium]
MGVLEVTPRATVRVVASAGDDLGVSRMALSGTVAPAGRLFERPLPITNTPDAGQSPRSARVDLLWALADLELKVGDRVQYTLVAWDNRSSESLQPQQGRGHTLQLDVVSADQLAEGAADELKRLADRLRRYLRLQERVLGDTLDHLQTLQDSPEFDPDAQLLRLSARQRRLADKIAAMRKSVAALADDLARNRIEQSAEKRQAGLFADQLRHEVERHMHQAAGQLTDARSQTERTEQASVVEQASTSERAAAQAIRTLLDQLTVWNDYQSVLTNLRELADQQQEITRQTAAAQEKTLGRQSARLSPEARDQLKQLAQAQDGTTTAIKRAIAELANLGKKLRGKQADDARALSDARKQLQTQGAAEKSQAAAQAIRRNHTALAQTAQRDVERALAEAVSRLEQREQRRLAELSRKLADTTELVKRLLTQQQEIQAATRATPSAEVQQLPKLAGRQRNLRKATLAVVDTLAELTETGEIAEYLREAVRIMSRATDALYELRPAVALRQHSGAIDYLQRAIEQLEQIREQKERAMKQAKLFALKRELLKTRRQQASINSATAKIIERIEQFGRLTRINVRRAKRQAKAQKELLAALNKLQEELSETPVYLWVVGRIAQAMSSSAEMLTQSPMHGFLPRAQRRALALLDQLIAAIRQTEAMNEEQFAEG